MHDTQEFALSKQCLLDEVMGSPPMEEYLLGCRIFIQSSESDLLGILGGYVDCCLVEPMLFLAHARCSSECWLDGVTLAKGARLNARGAREETT